MAQKKIGRPTLPPGEGKKFPLSMRTTKQIRDRLEASAKTSGRSLAHEVEYRVEDSFRADDARHEAFGDEMNYRLFVSLCSMIRLIEQRSGKRWLEDQQAFASAVAAINSILEDIKPRRRVRSLRNIKTVGTDGMSPADQDTYLRGFQDALAKAEAAATTAKPSKDE